MVESMLDLTRRDPCRSGYNYVQGKDGDQVFKGEVQTSVVFADGDVLLSSCRLLVPFRD